MKYFLKLFFTFCFVFNLKITAQNTDLLINDLVNTIKNALNAGGALDDNQTRQQYYRPPPPNNGISLGVYEALRSIARNDDLECVARLVCEAAAGGQPGHNGKQIKFDKLSLTSLMSYLQLGSSSSSPLLVFGRAALLGVSNRGDPYSCIINYPKCPKDQSRLLYYLNNHRGGFFQYFDKQYHKPGNYYNQNHYRPTYQYQNYQKKFKRNKIQFESPIGLYEKYKKKAQRDNYAKKYAYSSFVFPEESQQRYKKRMVFPKVSSRILPGHVSTSTEKFYFYNSNRFPKTLNELGGNGGFFPEKDKPLRNPTSVVTDRLPSKFYFPREDGYTKYSDYPVRYSFNSFFPSN